MMNTRLNLKSTLAVAFLTCAIFAQGAEARYITVGNSKMAYKTSDMNQREEGQPIIVFEAGFGSGGGSFETLFPLLPQNMPWIAYDRNGIGESDNDNSVETYADVTRKLHDLLKSLNVNPPYLLVGHSLGGPLIRLYAAEYPDQVCGLFFIDPTDFMLTEREDEQAKIKTESKTGYIEITRANYAHMLSNESLPAGIRAEVKRGLQETTPSFYGNYSALPPLEDIPVTVLIAYNRHIEPNEQRMNEELQLGINLLPWWKEFDLLRIAHYADMIKCNQNSSVVLLPQLSHGIHHQNPWLVAKALIDTYGNCLESAGK